MTEQESNASRSDSKLLSMLEEVLKQSKGRRLKRNFQTNVQEETTSLCTDDNFTESMRKNTLSNYPAEEDKGQGERDKKSCIETKQQLPSWRKGQTEERIVKRGKEKLIRRTSLSDILKEVKTSVDSYVTDNVSDDMASLCLSNGSGCTEFKRPSKSEVKPLTRRRQRQKSRRDVNTICSLRPSLFPNVPPCLNFVAPPERAARLPKKIRETVAWKVSNTTPILVSKIVSRSGIKFTRDGLSWISSWRHVTCEQYKLLKDNQKVNHFPGTFHLGRKDRLWLNISRMQDMHGKESFRFMPQTFILPQQLKQLRTAWVEAGCRSRWIVKPPAAARGIGVTVVHRWNDVPKTDSVIVQRYISRPYLINDSKFDLRLYVLVTSFDPLRLYIYEDGLVRFASVKYSRSIKNLGEKFIHLTNYSVNRANSCYTSNEEENVYEGHKWSLKCLWSYFRENGVDDKMMWSSLVDIVIKTFISCDEPVNRLVKIYSKNRYNSYELFGFDIMLDKCLKPWLLEVNISPSLHSNSQLDVKVKTQLIKDMFNTVGFQIPEDVQLTSTTQIDNLKKFGIQPEQGLALNKYLYRFNVNRDERMKQTRVHRGDLNYSFVLKKLNPDDIRQLILSEDELARCGRFIRIFPSDISSSYLHYFEKTRYYNILLDAWEKRHGSRRKVGIILLQSLCKRNQHLQLASSREDIANKVKPVSSAENVRTFTIGDSSPGDIHISSIISKRERMEGNRLAPLQNSRKLGVPLQFVKSSASVI